jgi:hypothetical protein
MPFFKDSFPGHTAGHLFQHIFDKNPRSAKRGFAMTDGRIGDNIASNNHTVMHTTTPGAVSDTFEHLPVKVCGMALVLSSRKTYGLRTRQYSIHVEMRKGERNTSLHQHPELARLTPAAARQPFHWRPYPQEITRRLPYNASAIMLFPRHVLKEKRAQFKTAPFLILAYNQFL